ncbi:MAG: hypothetical protein DRR19_21800 [Candidatus Parabeggiatoa sp. nov. 1]|nr:MAG: hypothetical protein DRR19_21800 [Gammaproteobacteria bacterium]
MLQTIDLILMARTNLDTYLDEMTDFIDIFVLGEAWLNQNGCYPFPGIVSVKSKEFTSHNG